MLPLFCYLLASYLLGSVPVGLLLGFCRGLDLREHGSRNIGATNAGRVLGFPFALAVFVVDFGKGLAPVLAAGLMVDSTPWSREGLALAAGVAAVLGHVFPLYLRFRGGKGVATAAGVFAGLEPEAALIALLLWVIVLAVSRMVALASLVAAWTLPISLLLLRSAGISEAGSLTLSSAVAVGVLITLRHRTNIGRMLRGEEPRVGIQR